MLPLVAALALALPAPPDDALGGEQQKLEGNWRMVGIELDGVKQPAEQVRGFSLRFKGGRFDSNMGGQRQTGTYTIDPSKKPKAMDIVPADGPDKGQTRPLIYELDGDTLRICGSEVGKGRPAGFPAKDAKGLMLMVLRRE